ncbi:hypothetical protein AB0O67_36300, partial [Streptomyces sp. NPDC086077]|uniref:hypothetical protein n=1 Tax=Streptomyces sp. NPDC086077 TaxID=3154862 RepID=UPI0034187C0A
MTEALDGFAERGGEERLSGAVRETPPARRTSDDEPVPETPSPIPVPEQKGLESSAGAETSKRRFVRIKRKRGPVELTFQPVDNGIDYLLSVTNHLADKPSPRDLKYAVLHLQAATEVLLKARLQLEYWALVFERPENASRDKFDSGDFQSCGTPEALKRLTDIAGLDLGINGSIDKDLKQLAKWRNALQHYGLTVPAPAVEKLAANVLDFLLAFVHEQLRPTLEWRERKALDRQMESVSEGLASINRFLTARWNRLREELKPLLNETVCCPLCMQNALLVDGEPICRFCQMAWIDGGDAAAAYVENVQGHSLYVNMKDGGDALITPCPECEHEALVADVELASGSTAEYFCFQCGTEQGPLSMCDVCGVPTP